MNSNNRLQWLAALLLHFFPLLGPYAIAQDQSVKPGINRQFENPDPKEFTERFEREGREVFDYRFDIVDACRLKPGMDVADIGAGTGLFTQLFAPIVGPQGLVYAVDIAQSFVDHITKTSKEKVLNNVVGVVCKAKSVELEPESIDLAFICDTYHHFEYPKETMRSIHRALRRGGEVIIVEFNRIEGVSSDWVLQHVRADRQVFADEIMSAGFRWVEEVELMKDSYFLRFAKVPDGESPPGAPIPWSADTQRGKRVIEWGWDEPDTKFMREHVEQMEQLPFDGLVFHMLDRNGSNIVWEMWGQRRFDISEFRHAIEDLQATPFRRLRDRFLRVNVTPGDVDWFDDDAWNVVANNFAVAAQVARHGKTKGFMFDVEQYISPLFDYSKQKHHGSKSFDEYRAQVRERGRQWMQVVNREFPDITILLTFGYSITQPKGESKNRSKVPYGLLADFLDGMLQVCSERTLIVDAWESSYPYKRRQQFADAYETIRSRSAEWCQVPDHYRRFVRAGFGLWMDYNWRASGWHEEDFAKNHFTPAEFEDALQAALQASDAYVWVYTEQPRWWTRERLPQAYIDAIRKAREPYGGDSLIPRANE